VTDRSALPDASPENSVSELIKKIAAAASAGIDWIQIREKDLSAKQLAALTHQALQAAQRHKLQPVHPSSPDPSQQGADQWRRLQPVQRSTPDPTQQEGKPADQSHSLEPVQRSNASPNLQPTTRPIASTRILINDRLDIAIAERAHGVHLGESSTPPSDALRVIHSAQQKGLVSDDFLLGVSCHCLESAKSAQAAGVDYIIFGPIFPTPSKAVFGEPQGLTRLGELCRVISIPILAIGGITLDNASACLNSGAAGIAAIRLFHDSADLASVCPLIRSSSP